MKEKYRGNEPSREHKPADQQRPSHHNPHMPQQPNKAPGSAPQNWPQKKK